MNPNPDFYRYLCQYKHGPSESDDDREITNTRIGSRTIYGGRYTVPDNQYDAFLSRYFEEIVATGKVEYLTESQLVDDGPLLLDLDMKFHSDVTTRLYTEDHVRGLVELLLALLDDMYLFDPATSLKIHVLEKGNVNPLPAKQITKDGLHLVVGIRMERKAQRWVRQQLIARLPAVWHDLPLTNAWDDVIDDAIVSGKNAWQLYGSTKPDHAPYQLTAVYHVTRQQQQGEGEEEEGEEAHWQTAVVRYEYNDVEQEARMTYLVSHFHELSARYRGHPLFFHSPGFQRTLVAMEDVEPAHGGRNVRRRVVTQTPTPGIGVSHAEVLAVRNADDLHALVEQFLQQTDYLHKETYQYTMALPPSFYEAGSYAQWIAVGWALRNTNDGLFLVFVAFSAQATGFDFSSVSDLYDKWQRFDLHNVLGKNRESILYWAKEHNRPAYEAIRLESVDYLIDRCLDKMDDMDQSKGRAKAGCGEYDITEVLFALKKDSFKCAAIRTNLWYEFVGHRWMEVDSGTTLRRILSTELRDLFTQKARRLMLKKAAIPAESTDAQTKEKERLAFFAERCLDISRRLAKTNDKKNLMTEAKDAFYDSRFMQELDKNSMLLCFNNGVVDFTEKTFRRGLPEDYVSKCTNIDFFPFDEENPEDVEIKEEIETFMHQLFPDAELYTYMWEHLASVLLGTPGTQCFHMYIGGGQNGKSVLISLMEMILGEYKSDVPLSLVTDRRTKIGGLAPEIVALRGTRYAVMQEPSKGDKINEGVMKQLTSGLDPIQARAPYAPQMVTFTPQFKLVLAANEFMKIASQDHGTWRRIRVVDFKSLFTDTPVEGDARKPYQFKLDRDLKERQFPRWKRVFVSLLVKKAMETQGKVQECEMVMASSESYRKRQDMFAEYIDCCVARVDHGHSEVKKAKLTTNFNVWWRKNYPHTMSPDPKELHDYMDKQFDRIDKNTWRGIRLLDPDGDDNQPMEVEQPPLHGREGQEGLEDVVEEEDIVMNTQYY